MNNVKCTVCSSRNITESEYVPSAFEMTMDEYKIARSQKQQLHNTKLECDDCGYFVTFTK